MLDVTMTASATSPTAGPVFLVPYPNRIRGKLSEDGKTLTTEWEGHTITLRPTHWQAATRNATPCTADSQSKTDDVKSQDFGGEEVSGVIHAGDFGGHWLSKTTW